MYVLYSFLTWSQLLLFTCTVCCWFVRLFFLRSFVFKLVLKIIPLNRIQEAHITVFTSNLVGIQKELSRSFDNSTLIKKREKYERNYIKNIKMQCNIIFIYNLRKKRKKCFFLLTCDTFMILASFWLCALHLISTSAKSGYWFIIACNNRIGQIRLKSISRILMT